MMLCFLLIGLLFVVVASFYGCCIVVVVVVLCVALVEAMVHDRVR